MAMHIGQINTNRDWGGGENQILHLMQGLQSRGVEVTLFAHPDGVLLKRAQESGCRVCEIPFCGRKPSVRRLSKTISERNVDLLHVHDSGGLSIGGRVGRSLDVPLVLSRRVASPLRRNPLSKLKYSHRNIAAVIAISQTVRNVFLRTSHFPGDAVYVVPTGIDIGELDGVERDQEWRCSLGGDAIVGGVGKLSVKKNWKFLVEVAARMKADGNRIQWVIAGDGDQREMLEAMARELEVDDCLHFLGFRSDALRVLKSLDLLFFPSVMEGASVTVRECMILGTPVVAVNAEGTMESLAGNGWGVENGDVDGAVQCVSEALSNRMLRQERVASARRYAIENYSYDRTVTGTLEVYRKVLGV